MYIKKVLSNGIRVIAEKVPYVKSVSLGVWVGNGSRYETREENGMSHFIEHMVFKGTNTRSASDIALEMDSVGGQLNAFTTRETTCFYAKTLYDNVEVSADILSDMVFEPSLTAEDTELERRVVFEEIAMYEDSPEDLVYDLSSLNVWGDTPMGRPILGSVKSLNTFTPEMMREYMRTHYTSKNIVVAVAGNFDDSLFDILEKYFGGRPLCDNEIFCEKAVYTPHSGFLNKDLEQVQLVACFDSIDICDEACYQLLLFNNIFGSGMSSRLFQNIREKYGLVYSISAGHSAYIGTGLFDIAVAASAENVGRVSELVAKEIRRIKKDKLSKEELERSKVQLKGNYLLSHESVSSRMQILGRAELLGKRCLTSDETIDRIMAVTQDDIAEIIDRIFVDDMLSVTAVGPIDSIDGLFGAC